MGASRASKGDAAARLAAADDDDGAAAAAPRGAGGAAAFELLLQSDARDAHTMQEAHATGQFVRKEAELLHLPLPPSIAHRPIVVGSGAELVQQGGGDDSLLQQAWDQIGDYFSERQKKN